MCDLILLQDITGDLFFRESEDVVIVFATTCKQKLDIIFVFFTLWQELQSNLPIADIL